MSKHTPEPWEFESEPQYCSEIIGSNGDSVCTFVEDPSCVDVDRILSCVNACAGMADPAAEIAELKRQRDELLAALGVAIPLIKQARLDWCDQNAESYDDDVVTPYDDIFYLPVLSLLENKGSAS